MTIQQTCPDCGTEVGKPHHNHCDVERCSSCGQQNISCQCEDHDPMKSVWTGQLSNVVAQETNPSNQPIASKRYRVTLKVPVEVEVELDARNEDEAERKAIFWDGGHPEGSCEVGWYLDEYGELIDGDNGEMLWGITDIGGDIEVRETYELRGATETQPVSETRISLACGSRKSLHPTIVQDDPTNCRV